MARRDEAVQNIRHAVCERRLEHERIHGVRLLGSGIRTSTSRRSRGSRLEAVMLVTRAQSALTKRQVLHGL